MRTETFQTPGHVSLEIRLGGGEIRIETDDVTETTVELEPLRDSEASIAAVEEARIEARQRGDGHVVIVDVSKSASRRFGRGAEVRVHIRAPHGADVNCQSGSADIAGSGRFGSVEVECGSGNVAFDDVQGDVKVSAASGDVQMRTVGGQARLNTASGDVQVQSVEGPARVNSASGDILVREVGGSFEANSASGDVMVKEARSGVAINSASGDQQIGSVTEGKVTLRSASGDLKVGIRQGSRLWVDARSRSGDVTSELDVTDLPPEGEAPLIELRANTMSGDINVIRAPLDGDSSRPAEPASGAA